MKILYIATEYTGGMRPYALSILKMMWNENSYAVIVIRDEYAQNDFIDFPQNKIFIINYPKGKLARILFHIFPFKIIFTIRNLISCECINIVHTLTGEFILSYYFVLLQKKVKILHTVHDAIEHEMKFKSVFAWLNNIIFLKIPNKLLLAFARNTITNSISQLYYLQKHYKNGKHFSAPFPTLITEEITKGDIYLPELKGENNYILFFGRVEFYKGVHNLYDTYMSYPKLHDYKLVIAGKGETYFNKNIKENNVIIINRYINDSEINDLFRKASLVVYPYISATQSGVLSIASYFGKKIITSDIPFFNELINSETLGIRTTNTSNKLEFFNNMLELLNVEEDTFHFYQENYLKASIKTKMIEIHNSIFNDGFC
ncbi:MAG: glycosyltransferase [Muribaculaceae bacterium]